MHESSRLSSPSRRPPASDSPDEPLSPERRWKRILSAGAAALFVVLGIETMLAGTAVPQRSDFPVYWLAGKAVLEGKDIYGVIGPHGWRYIYPPPFALAIAPLALLPQALAMLVWFLLSALLTVWAVRMCVTMARDRLSSEKDVLWLGALPALLLLGYYVSAITRGQASVLMLWLVVAAVFWEWKGRNVAGASCLAGAILIKVFPAFLLAYFAWRRRWRFVLATLALVAVGAFVLPGAILGAHRNWSDLRHWEAEVGLPALGGPTPPEKALEDQLFDFHKIRNESLYAVIRRLTHSERAREWAGGITLAMAAATWAAGRRTSSRDGLFLSSAAIVWALLAPPVSWSHYFVLMLLPLTALVALARRREDVVAARAAWVALVLFGTASIASVALKGSLEKYGIPCWAALVVWGALLLPAVRKRGLIVREA